MTARAGNRCEYCHLPQQGYAATFHVDHVRAAQHGRDDHPDNLALSCPKCNRKKGPNLAAVDPLSQAVVAVFHPRQDRWGEHFHRSGPIITGLTSCGRATLALLDLNDEDRLRLRSALIAEGVMEQEE